MSGMISGRIADRGNYISFVGLYSNCLCASIITLCFTFLCHGWKRSGDDQIQHQFLYNLLATKKDRTAGWKFVRLRSLRL